MGLEWGPEQIAVAGLDKAGKTEVEIVKQTGYTRAFVNKVRRALKAGDKPPEIPVTPPTPSVPNPPAGDNKTWEDKLPPIVKEKLAKIGKGGKPDGETVKLPKITTETVDATILQLIPQVQQVPLTPGIYNGYLCAKIRGFPGTIADWLELASVDFWTGRGKNPFAIVGGYASGNDDDNEGGQDVGKGTG